MYQSTKIIIKALITKEFLFQHEEKWRSAFSHFYSGNKFECNICYKKLKHFITLSNEDSLCPNCGSLKRNRRLWQLLETEFLKPEITLLDFSPSRCLYRKLKKTHNINYQSTDLSGDFIADNKYDIRNIQVDDASFDLILCCHILEHIEEDIIAIKELYRILKPGAKALVQTPFKEGDIYEDYSIISDAERLKHFGQEDHVRIYSVNGLKERLESIRFSVEVRTNFKDDNINGFDPHETILVLTKPLN